MILDLPLNLIAVIVTFLDNVADLARLTRTSRLLHYMTLPQLYSTVTLHAYSGVVNGKAESQCLGGASSFTEGLNAIVTTRNIANLVRSCRLCGEIEEYDIEECSKPGRAPDSTLMLNILIRVAVDKMKNLRAFSWEMPIKLSRTVYEGLSLRETLSSLTIRFPSGRAPRPTTTLPPFPHLKNFRVTNIDPLCYPDDISLLLLQSRQLTDLTLVWSPRMQEEESEVNLRSFFGRCLDAGRTMSVTKVTMKNLYTSRVLNFDEVFDFDSLKSLTFINSRRPTPYDYSAVFLEGIRVPKPVPKLTVLRFDVKTMESLEMLNSFRSIERLYFVTGKHKQPKSNFILSKAPVSNSSFNTGQSMGYAIGACKAFLEVITQNHGTTLCHLLLPNYWSLGKVDVNLIVERCPVLEQMALRINADDKLECFRHLLASLPRLSVLRSLSSSQSHANIEISILDEMLTHKVVTADLCRAGCINLRWLELAGKIYKCEPSRVTDTTVDKLHSYIPVVRRVTMEDAKDVEMWSMESDDV